MADEYLARADVWTVLDLIVAEFTSDAHSVQCFDRRLVDRAIALNKERRAARYELGQTPLEDQADRDAVLLALAILSLDRPGWIEYLRDIACAFGDERGRAFEAFRQANADRWKDRPLL